ncbi:MAG: flagellar motor switch protein FliN [Gammaproteobacteria bacterium]|nr:flagellar motor switch protein FliN [Gammaproteobacteria bacterium]
MSKQKEEQDADDLAAALDEKPAPKSKSKANNEDIEKVEAESLSENASFKKGDLNLDVVLDIPVTIAMEIGRTKLSIRNLLQLNQGSIIELDRLAGEPMDVVVNGTLVAHGEVVVVNEKFGIRLTDVISPSERIKNLK